MLLLISASPVRAQATLWVATFGNDGAACSQASPCLTFQGAVNKGNASQINCLNSGDYGAVTITASITIDCGTGNVGIIQLATGNAGNGNAITISTPAAATIVLRHLSLNGYHNGFFGINTSSFSSGTLVVDECTIQGFTQGILFTPQAGRGLLQVSDSQILDNTVGIAVSPNHGQIASVALSQVAVVTNSFAGLELNGAGTIAGTMRDSIAGEGAYGVTTDASTQSFFTIENSSVIANTTAGILTQSAGAVLNVGASTFGANAVGVQANAGSIISFGNNQFSANTADGTFTGMKAVR
jgi:hypothetical protein